MSGGHWDYEQSRLEEVMVRVGNDGQVVRRFPKLAQVYRDLGSVLSKIAHDIDWDLSGDTEIKDDRQFEIEMLEKIAKVLKVKYKVRVYEEGNVNE